MDNLDEAFVDEIREREEFINKHLPIAFEEMKKLNNMDNKSFIFYIKNNSDYDLNFIAPNFPAYDIIKKAIKYGWELTIKQKNAITNVYLYSKYYLTQKQIREIMKNENY